MFMSSPTQYSHSPFGETEAATKSPPSRLPDEKVFTTCPCKVVMNIAEVLLQTTMWSVFLGNKWTELTDASPPLKGGGGLKVCKQSVVFASQTLTVQSLEAVITRLPSAVKMA